MRMNIETRIDNEQGRRAHRAPGFLRATLLLLPVLSLSVPSRAAFLDPGFGVRPEGMGGAFVAVADDANSLEYNPAGSVRVGRSELALSYAKPFAGLGADVDLGLFYASYVRAINNRLGFGLGWSQLNSPNLKENIFSLNLAANPGEIFHLGRDLNIGWNIKRMSRAFSLDERTVGDPVFAAGDSKDVYSFDFGAWARPLPEFLPGMTAGFALKNLNQPDAGLLTEDVVPMESVVGFGYQRKSVLLAFDFSERAGRQTFRGGAETWFFGNRFGARAGGSSAGGSIGMSYRQPFGRASLQIDYAFMMPFQVTDSAGTHRFSFALHR